MTSPFNFQIPLLTFFFMLYLGCVDAENAPKTDFTFADYRSPYFFIFFTHIGFKKKKFFNRDGAGRESGYEDQPVFFRSDSPRRAGLGTECGKGGSV